MKESIVRKSGEVDEARPHIRLSETAFRNMAAIGRLGQGADLILCLFSDDMCLVLCTPWGATGDLIVSRCFESRAIPVKCDAMRCDEDERVKGMLALAVYGLAR